MGNKTLQLAQCIMSHSLNVQPGENVFIEWMGQATLPLLRAMINVATEMGANPVCVFNDPAFTKEFLFKATPEQITAKAEMDLSILRQCQSFVRVRAEDDPFWETDLPPGKIELYNRLYVGPVHMRYRIPHTRWCVLRYPSPIKAALAGMSLQEYEDFYFNACLVDYHKMHEAAVPLKKLLEQTDKVRIVAPGTDVSFSLKGQKAEICSGYRNIPDGEVCTSPVKNSVNGKVSFNTETVWDGEPFSNISLTFENGRIVSADCVGSKEKLERILNLDEGSRYLGEFALGVNPNIRRVMKENLYDEKIAGSFHMAIGNQLPYCRNGNESAIHWDLIQQQTAEYGGGEIYFDGVLVRKDGFFVVDELKGLNAVQ